MSRLREFFRHAITACQPPELREARREIGRLNNLLAAEKMLRAAVTIRSMDADAVITRSRTALAAFDDRGVNNITNIPTPAEVLDAWRASLEETPEEDDL